MSLKKLAAGVALTTLASLLAGHAAMAQSTASQVSEVIVTTNSVRSTEGLAVQTQVAKNQSIVGQQYISKQLGSVNAAQLINLLPGVSYSTSDPTGVLSDDFRIHGFDGNHVSFTIDGTPVNDTGNYASYPGEYLTTEVTDRVTVNIGSTEVDSPSASAIGGTVNIVTKTPPKELGFIGSVTGGTQNYYRGYGEVDTGEIGPWGTRAFFSGNYMHSDKYKGGGNIERAGVDFRVYQPLRDKDFISIAGTYNRIRAAFYESSSLAQYAQFGRNLDWNTQWGVPTVTAGKADGVGGPSSATSPGFQQGGNGGQGFWAYHQNPVDFGDIRVQSRFDLSHGFTFTFDPYFFYTLANGGGSQSLSETDPRLIGRSGSGGIDLNGDGDKLDKVLVYSPNNTQTHRFGFSTSLLYDLNEHSHFQLAYNLDYGNHRQTGVYSHIDQQTGKPDNLFGGSFGGQAFVTQDGSTIRGRDRFSVAELSQVSANYIGRYFEDKLHINVGVRNPVLTRKLNQYCYQYSGTSQYCDTVDPSLVQAAYNAGVAAKNTTALSTLLFGVDPSTGKPNTTISYNSGTNAPNFRFPFKGKVTYQRALPNAGASYNFDSSNQVYITYAQGFSAPRTDNLYSSSTVTVKPEITDNYGMGYRYQTGKLTASVSPWYSIWTNHIVTTFDRDDPTISVDRNVGKVTLYGVDLEAGYRPIEHLSLYASASFMNSRLENNYPVSVSKGPNAGAIVDLPVKGKQLVLTPNEMFALRGDYEIGQLRIGLEGKYTGERYVSDMNDQSIPGFTVVNLDAEYKLEGFGKNTRLGLSVYNLFNAQYFNRSGTNSATQSVNLGGGNTYSGGTLFYYTGAPTTVYGSLKFAF